MQESSHLIPITGFIDRNAGQIIFDLRSIKLPERQEIAVVEVEVEKVPQEPPARSFRRRQTGARVAAVEDMPYRSSLPTALAFAQVVLDGGTDQQIDGHHLLTDAEYLALYNRSPGWACSVARVAFQAALTGRVTPSAAFAGFAVANRLNPNAASQFAALLSDRSNGEGQRILGELQAIKGHGQRVEQLRKFLVEFRSFAGLRATRPIFPHLTRA